VRGGGELRLVQPSIPPRVEHLSDNTGCAART
jgi:hypothetical protein